MSGCLKLVFAAALSLPAACWSQIENIAITSGASFQPGLPAAGSIGTIFCTGLVVDGVVSAPGFPLPYELAGVTVTVGSAPAPLFAVANHGSYQQINFQVPLEIRTEPSPLQVAVAQSGLRGAVAASQQLTQVTGDFFQIGGSNFGVFQHAGDCSLVAPDNPAHAGEMLIGYATGLRAAIPPVPTSFPAPLAPLSYVPQTHTAVDIDILGLRVNGSLQVFNEVPLYSDDTTGQFPIPFMGLAPGLAGVYQINFVLPQNTPSGNIPIQLARGRCGGPIDRCAFGIRYTYGESVLLPVR
jgi:uncharacterized protein (TIGR03437 family)